MIFIVVFTFAIGLLVGFGIRQYVEPWVSGDEALFDILVVVLIALVVSVIVNRAWELWA